jgi:DNA-binding NtrC family response regulator
LERLEANALEVVLLDVEMPVKNGLDVLKEMRQRGCDAAAIMITAYGTIDRAVQAMKEGAYDFIAKPFDLDHIVLVVERALERTMLKHGLEQFAEQAADRYRLVGAEVQKCAQQSIRPKKRRIADLRYCCLVRVARAKRFSPAQCTIGAIGKRRHSSPSTVSASPKTF